MKRKKVIFILSLFLVFSVFLSFIYISKSTLVIKNYNIPTDKLKSSIKIAFISDLHCKEFGKNNSLLVEAIAKEEPDFIAIGGDMVNSWEKEHSVSVNLLKQLVNIAPTYYIHGNHELSYLYKDSLEKDIKSAGVTMLDNNMVDFSLKNGEKVTIGGLSGFPYYEVDAPDYDNEERHFLDAFIKQQDNNFAILLAHQPELYFWGLDEKNIDLMLCGHTHGGVVQLPFVGGVYAPNQGFFPEYDKGYFSSGTANMIITSGLGNTSSVPRINNEPEICIININ